MAGLRRRHPAGPFLNNPSRREISAVESGTPRFAWTEQDANGFLLFKYGDSPWNDAPFNPHRLSEPFTGHPIPRGTHSRTFTFLVHADTGRIAAMRMLTWPAYFLNHVVSSVHRLAARDYSAIAAHTELQDFYRHYPDGPSLYRLVRTLPPGATCTGGQREDHPHSPTTDCWLWLLDTGEQQVRLTPAPPAATSTPVRRAHPQRATPGRLEPLAEEPEVSPPRPGVQAPAEHLGPPVSLRSTPRSSDPGGACAPAPTCGL